MSFEFYYTLILFILLTVVLVREITSPELAIFSTLILLLIGKVISVKEAFSGFSNEGVLTIAVLYIVAGSLQSTGTLQTLGVWLMGRKRSSPRRKLARLLFPVAGISGFINNTPLVSIFMPVIKNWSEKNDISPAKFLLPLSYATILGGMCTLIGTSTNLLAHGLMIQTGHEGFAFFELARFAWPAAVLGIGYLIFIGIRLIPDRQTPMAHLGETTREFVVELKVTAEYDHLNKSIEEAGLRHLKGLYLFQIERDGTTITPAKPTDRIVLNDRLFFTGLPKTILEIQRTKGLALLQDPSFELKHYDSDQIKTYEAVISASSDLVGKNVRASNFRERFDAVIVAIHRNGERIEKKVGDIVLRAGDTLLLLATKEFKKHWYHSTEFCLISHTEEIPSKPKWRAYFSIGIFALMALIAAADILPLIAAMGIAAVLLIVTRTISDTDALQSIDFKTLLTIAASFGIAAGMQTSGICDFFAARIIDVCLPYGAFAVLAGVYLVTTLYTNFITNNTAVILMLPIALSTAATLAMNAHPFAIAVVMGANSSFATPISYQTNLMVYGPGGYKFSDYLKTGIPLQFIVGASVLFMIYIYYF